MAAGSHFLLLLWKNWLLQKRKPIVTVIEILLPAVFAAILLILRQLVDRTEFTEPRIWRSFQVEKFPEELVPPSLLPPGGGVPAIKQWRLAYSPDLPIVRQIMERTEQQLNLNTTGLIFNNEEDLLAALAQTDGRTSDIWGAVVFTSLTEDDLQLPKDIQYKIRPRSEQRIRIRLDEERPNILLASDWYTKVMFPLFQFPGPRNADDYTGGDPFYMEEGFLAIQRTLDKSITMALSGDSAEVDEIEVHLQRYPYPSYVEDLYILVSQYQLPFITLFSFLVVAPNLAKDIVLEKERRLKEFMKMMGMSSWIHWSAWFVKYLMFMLLSVAIMTFLFNIEIGTGAVINAMDPSFFFFFLLLYAITSICFVFAISVFFKKANSAAAAGGILFFLTYVPYFFMQQRLDELSVGVRMIACLFSNVAMALGCVQISVYEGTGAGLQWNNFMEPVSVDDQFTMGHVILMLIIDCIIYLLIVWYVDNVLPGDFGIPRKWYFPFTKDYWCGRDAKVADEENDLNMFASYDPELFESNPSNMHAGIKIRNLRKEFTRNKMMKVAVDRTNLDMFEGQITALLGHNGAGKTTTMSMLTGFLPPTSGTAYVHGYDIRTDIEKVRESLGLCPQHDVLFDTMTVREHLVFFGKLKGINGNDIDREVKEMISVLHLEDKTDVQSKSLSGGMKRKLSVGIALIGGSKIVILDEPTSGMDPEARRQMWDILQQQREGRTMVLSTHFMDEADLLGDRIAIMAEGVVQCCGTSLFLKNKYGVGYHMVMVKNDNCDVKAVTQIITDFVPDAKLESNISAELSYILPHESAPKFEALFTYMEENKDKLGIDSFGASVTTMEEVFLKVGESVDDTLQEKLHQGSGASNGVTNHAYENNDPQISATPSGNNDKREDNGPIAQHQSMRPPQGLSRTMSMEEKYGLKPVMSVSLEKNTGMKLYAQQFKAMFIKRIIHTLRNKIVTITQLAMPLLFTTIAGVVLKTLPEPQDPPALSLTMDYFANVDDLSFPYLTNMTNFTDSGALLVDNLVDSYRSYIDPLVKHVEYVNEMEGYENDPSLARYLGDIGAENIGSYGRDYMIAAEFRDLDPDLSNSSVAVFGLYNNQAYHTIAITLGAVGNALVRFFVSDEYSIEAINHPLPKSESTQLEEDIQTSAGLSFVVSNNVLFGQSFLIATFIVFIIKERTTKAKHIQFVSGVHVFNYWMSTFAWDLINYMIPATLQLALFAILDFEPLVSGSNLGYMYLLLILFAFSILPFVYLMSKLFEVPASGYVWMVVINLFTGTAAVLAIFILQVPELGTEDVANVLEWVFYALLPNFCFGFGMQGIYQNYEYKRMCGSVENLDILCVLLEATGNVTNPCCPKICDQTCATYHDNYFAWESPGIGRPVVFLVIQSVVFFSLIFVFESGAINSLIQKAVESTTYSDEEEEGEAIMLNTLHRQMSLVEDNDVVVERARIANTPLSRLQETDSLILMELRKFYSSFLAVDRLAVGIPQGECFGLLGVNGAGKTTTFKMMTGDIPISSGDAFLDGFSVKRNMKEVQTRLGYCPQFDALIDQMTVRETLVMYARLRGVQENQIPGVVDKLVENLLLSDHVEKQAADLSGGNKRKLSTAIALIGDPPVVFLDEPTTGMDPVARRLLWDTLTKVRASGRTLVLTSHSMEECEALCTRLAIMVNGQFKCLGSPQHLKTKFGEGYTLLAKVGGTLESEVNNSTTQLMAFIQNSFPGSSLTDAHHGYVHYQINSDNISWAKVFGTMERAKAEYNVDDYSVSQTTLEQVFINFARAQRAPREEAPGCTTQCGNCFRFFCCCGCRQRKNINTQTIDTHV